MDNQIKQTRVSLEDLETKKVTVKERRFTTGLRVGRMPVNGGTTCSGGCADDCG